MADIAYSRKYRPSVLNDYMGEETKTKIMNRLHDEKNFPQVTLLYGTRGTGKTTLARLMAKEYLCLDRKDGHACNKCAMCMEIDDELINAEFGASTMGVTEVNIGTDGGKADIEALVKDMEQPPTYPYKFHVYILDECHMLTPGAQNALLKVLEEPPKHLCLILATTDPEKLLGTIRDRCQLRVKMKPASIDDLVARMLYICEKEGIKTSNQALKAIARICKRNPRDCLMTLENVAKNNSYDCTIDNVLAERGALATDVYEEYIKAATRGVEDILRFYNGLEEKGIQPIDFIRGFTGFVMDCMMVQFGIGIEDMTVEFVKAAKTLFKSYNSEELDCLLQIVEYANKMISSDESMGRLILTTTAMRIGKLKLLAIGLQHAEQDSIEETDKGNKIAVKRYRDELNEQGAKPKLLTNSLMAPVFGANVREVKAGININATQDDIDTSDEKMMSDDDLLKLFES